jgi:hypothetical protein
LPIQSLMIASSDSSVTTLVSTTLYPSKGRLAPDYPPM